MQLPRNAHDVCLFRERPHGRLRFFSGRHASCQPAQLLHEQFNVYPHGAELRGLQQCELHRQRFQGGRSQARQSGASESVSCQFLAEPSGWNDADGWRLHQRGQHISAAQGRMMPMNRDELLDNARYAIAVSDESFAGLSLREADLSATTFDHVDFSGCDFARADLTEASFHQCRFEGATFEGAMLKSAIFNECDARQCEFGHADLGLSIWQTCDLSGSRIESCNLTHAAIKDSVLEQAGFANITTDHGVFHQCELSGAAFRNTQFSQLIFFKEDLASCVFEDVQFEKTVFLECSLHELAFARVPFVMCQFID